MNFSLIINITVAEPGKEQLEIFLLYLLSEMWDNEFL